MGYSLNELPKNIQQQVRAKDRGEEPKTKVGRQVITVGELAPGLNSENGMQRLHWTKYHDVKKRWIWLIRRENPKKHPGKVKVKYTRKSTQMMDPDNVGASFKVIGDALEALGIIENDSFDIITEFKVAWKKATKRTNQCSIIEITDVN